MGGLESASLRQDLDYLDGVAFSDTGGMIIAGSFVDTVPPGSVAKPYGLWPVFYESLVHEGTEYMPTLDYLWRWDADWFWCTQIFPGLRWWIVRWLCGPALLRSDNYKAFNDMVISNVAEPLKLNKNEELVIQDVDIPADRSAEFIRSFQRVVRSQRIGKIKLTRPGSKQTTVPIWLCPVKGTASPFMPQVAGKLYINFGFWDSLTGPETQGGMAVGNVNKALEALVVECDGKKTLYSSVFLSEESFMQQYNGEHYNKIKSKYDPTGRLRSWYDRVTKA